ncbi:MAG TPA: peptidoglycan-binding protein, partial [Puia sp.]|nr:peptidoglycan-binding protein [Puia sp.]
MNYRKRSVLFLFPMISMMAITACHEQSKHPGVDKDEVKTPAQVDEHAGTDLKSMLQYAADNGDKLNDSTVLVYRKLADSVYGSNGYTPIWSDKQRWLPAGDSLLSLIEGCKVYGLFPSDYHYASLSFFRRVIGEDTLARKNAATWNRADLLLTDAFFMLVKHLRQGRLDYDSVTLRRDSVLPDSFFTRTLATARQFGVRGALDSLEPRHPGYDSLKAYLGAFLAGAHFRKLTWLDYPYKDSAVFYTALTRRLQEVGYIDSSVTLADTAMLASALRKYQETNKLKVTGKASQETVTMMDNSDWEKFKRIAINLDRYKLLPDTLPRTYVWVDLPAFSLQVRDADTVALE